MSTLLALSDEARDLAERIMAVEEARQAAETDEARDALAAAEAELEDLLVQVGDDLTAKADGYGDVIAEFAARAEVMKAQEQMYKRKRQVAENAAGRLKDRLHFVLEDLGLKRVDGERWKITVQASPPSVVVTDEELAMNAGFAEIVREVKLDKQAIIARWREDPQSVARFAEVVQGTHLRIR